MERHYNQQQLGFLSIGISIWRENTTFDFLWYNLFTSTLMNLIYLPVWMLRNFSESLSMATCSCWMPLLYLSLLRIRKTVTEAWGQVTSVKSLVSLFAVASAFILKTETWPLVRVSSDHPQQIASAAFLGTQKSLFLTKKVIAHSRLNSLNLNSQMFKKGYCLLLHPF